jgi:uncharacterized membrane protein YedE/YeeE
MPVASAVGGVLIGLAAVALMLTLGRIAGATGIMSGLFFPAGSPDWLWRAAMIAGMISALPVMYVAGLGPVEINVPVSPPMLAAGGVIVGVGVVLGSGCTSGHGVCGLARLSPRSLAATLTFMASTAATVLVVRHILGG